MQSDLRWEKLTGQIGGTDSVEGEGESDAPCLRNCQGFRTDQRQPFLLREGACGAAKREVDPGKIEAASERIGFVDEGAGSGGGLGLGV